MSERFIVARVALFVAWFIGSFVVRSRHRARFAFKQES